MGGVGGRLAAVRVYDACVPAATVTALRQAIARVFVPRGKGRSSYAASLGWYALANAPTNVFEQVIRHLAPIARVDGDVIGGEYWARIQPPTRGFDYHFDRDEAIGARVVSPTLSSILYLSDAGGPTVIVDATPASTRAGKRVIAVFPRPARYATFPGELLHGVQAGEPARWPRVAFFVNWWAHRPGGTVDAPVRWAREAPLRGLSRAAELPRPTHGEPRAFAATDVLDPAGWRRMIARAAAPRTAGQ